MAELLNYHPARQLALHAECQHRAIAFKATSGLANEPAAVACFESLTEKETEYITKILWR